MDGLYPITFLIKPKEPEVVAIEERVETDEEFEEEQHNYTRLAYSDFSDESDFLGPIRKLIIESPLASPGSGIAPSPLVAKKIKMEKKSSPAQRKRKNKKEERSSPPPRRRKIKKEDSSSPAPIARKITAKKESLSPQSKREAAFKEYASHHRSDFNTLYPDKQGSEITLMLRLQFSVYFLCVN